MQVKSWAGFCIIIWPFGLRSNRLLVVETSGAGEVMGMVFHNHMVHWSKVRSYVGA